MLGRKLPTAALLLCYISVVAGHGAPSASTVDMGGMNNSETSSDVVPLYLLQYRMQSYAGLHSHTGLILAHIVLEVIAWVFVLPIGLSAFSRICQLSR